MKTRVQVAAVVEAFVKAQGPEPRRQLTRAIKALGREQGDAKPLEGRLAGYSRLRVAGYRIIFTERADSGERVIDCVFAERRGVVYEILEKLFAKELGGD